MVGWEVGVCGGVGGRLGSGGYVGKWVVGGEVRVGGGSTWGRVGSKPIQNLLFTICLRIKHKLSNVQNSHQCIKSNSSKYQQLTL